MVDLLKTALKQTVNKFLQKYQTTWDINNGGCEDFALETLQLFEDLGGTIIQKTWPEDLNNVAYAVWLEDLYITENNCEWEDCPEYCSHYVIVFNNCYYDAECIEGVDDWKQLPLVVNAQKPRDERKS